MELILETLCKNVCEHVKEVGSFIQSERIKFSADRIEVKGKNDFVSYVDKTAERLLIEKLSILLPQAGYIAEEGTSIKRGEIYNWIIDPLDGTTNFIHGIPCYAISIALMKEKEIILGVVYEINLNECFYAWHNSKAYLNEKEINVSTTKTLANSLLATGFPYYDYSKMDEYLKLFSHYMQHTHGLRRLGSAATDLAYVACGRFDGFYEYGLQPWDVAAGAFIVQQAGGKITDFKGSDNFIFGKEIITSNPLFFNEFLASLQLYFN
ncbi:MAG: inositol monophosphatase family protein [Bacteroidia bacterium]